MATVIWQATALADIERQFTYLATLNPAAASRVAAALLDAGNSLEFSPNRGRPGRIPGTRELVVRGKYVLGYHVKGSEVRIVRVWHHAQQRGE